MNFTAIISLLLILGLLGVSTIAYGVICLFIIIPVVIASLFLFKEVAK